MSKDMLKKNDVLSLLRRKKVSCIQKRRDADVRLIDEIIREIEALSIRKYRSVHCIVCGTDHIVEDSEFPSCPKCGSGLFTG